MPCSSTPRDLLAAGVVVNVDDALGECLVVDAGAGVDVQGHAGDVIGPARLSTLVRGVARSNPRTVLEFRFRSKITAAPGGLKRGIGGHGQPHLDVAVQHRAGGSRAADEDLHGLAAERAGSDDVGPAIDGLEELALDLGGGRGSRGLEDQVVAGVGGWKIALVLGQGDRGRGSA